MIHDACEQEHVSAQPSPYVGAEQDKEQMFPLHPRGHTLKHTLCD